MEIIHYLVQGCVMLTMHAAGKIFFNWKITICKGQGRSWRDDGICVGPQRKYIRFWTGRGRVPGGGAVNKKKQQKNLKGLTHNFKEKVFIAKVFRELIKEPYFFKAVLVI